MSRRLRFAGVILLVLIWSGVLLTPQLRLILCSQVNALRSQSELDLVNNVDLSQAVAAHPNDPRVLALNAETEAAQKDQERRKKREAAYDTDFETPPIYDPSDQLSEMNQVYAERKAILKVYDQLIARFPRQAWLIQNRLRLSTFGAIQLERDKQKNPNEYYSPTWLNNKELLQAIEIADRGARLEPQNSFYDWMRAMFFFALNRDEEALRALGTGARKTDFQAGTFHDVNNRIAVRQMQTPLLWEERLMIFSYELLPHLARMRETGRVAVQHAATAERKGDHVRALRIYEAVSKLGFLMRRDGDLITAQTGVGIMSIAWGGLTRRLQINESTVDVDLAELPKRMKILASRFAAYARQHGRADLAREAEHNAQDVGPFYKFNNDTYSQKIFALPSGNDAREIYRWKWAGILLLRAFFWCGLAWLGFVGLQQVTSWRCKTNNEKRNVSLVDSDVMPAAIFVALAFGMVLFVAQRFLSLQAITDWVMYGDPNPSIYGLETANRIIPVQILNRWLPFIPLALTLFYGFIAAVWRGRKAGSTPSTNTPRGCAASALLFVVITAAMALFVFLQLRLVWELSLDSEAVKNWLPLYAPVLVVVALWFILVFRYGIIWLAAMGQVLSRLHNSQLISQTLLVLIVALSGVYLFTSVASFPIRREANMRLDDFLARGEVVVVRDMPQEKP